MENEKESVMRIYTVWCPDLGSDAEDGHMFKARDPQDAACQWAKREDCNSADYWIVGGQDANVMVRSSDGVDHALIVSGETVAHYRARLKVPA